MFIHEQTYINYLQYTLITLIISGMDVRCLVRRNTRPYSHHYRISNGIHNKFFLLIKNFYTNVYTQTMTNASFPQKRKGYWSIIVWTMSSRCGLICSKRPISENSMGKRVGHQHMARFFESMLFNLQFSDTLKNISKFSGQNFFKSLNNSKNNLITVY